MAEHDSPPPATAANAAVPPPPAPAAQRAPGDTTADQPASTRAPVGATTRAEPSPVGPGVNTPVPTTLQPEQPNAMDPLGRVFTPFADERQVMDTGLVMEDDISAAQMSGQATRSVSARHLTRLLYQALDDPGGPVYQAQHLGRQLDRGRS